MLGTLEGGSYLDQELFKLAKIAHKAASQNSKSRKKRMVTHRKEPTRRSGLVREPMTISNPSTR